ncbi:metabolite traffic protein EboE [Streptomyces sp. MSC1_001]|jgi:hypothetical protein|uniref:metabolite traffic protein EboE n=1 Tax=Streptomyces sp. MSC1_001 TaxID=2909263 RepID=UPI002030D075|nr:metabolite traffic protein EboE [Streptomyces sp. MSC1_001]
MRLYHRSGQQVHLGYSTNVHPAEDLEGVLGQLDTYAVPVRERLGADRLGLGLWLAGPVAAKLASDASDIKHLRVALAERGLEVVSLNGFPYQGFHLPGDKTAVYRPDWTSPQRLAYTINLARVLALLLPDDVTEGSISTLPLGWRGGWTAEQNDTVLRHITLLHNDLLALQAQTGHRISIAFEPEPGCRIETTAQVVRHLAGLDPAFFGVCLDTCHMAVAFEEPHAVLSELTWAGIDVFKTQVSCALHAETPGDPATRQALRAFDEPLYLHQTRRLGQPPVGVDDLPDALHGPTALQPGSPWRTHFHIPVHADPPPPLASTRPVLRRTLQALLTPDQPVTRHFEVETYTWTALPQPPRTRQELIDGIAAELAWTRRELLGLGLTERPAATD